MTKAKGSGLALAYVVPHPPNLLDADLQGQKLACISALKAAGKKLTEAGVDLILAVTAHWRSAGHFLVDASKSHAHLTDYYGSEVEVEYAAPGDPKFAAALMAAGKRQGLNVGTVEARGMDHGVTIPLHFMQPKGKVPVVPLSVSTRPLKECRRWGAVIAETAAAEKKKAALLVSTSLSHNFAYMEPGRTDSAFSDFDETLLAAIEGNDFEGLLLLEGKPSTGLAQPEGALTDIAVLSGAVDGKTGKRLAYEGIWGLGFGVVEFDLQ